MLNLKKIELKDILKNKETLYWSYFLIASIAVSAISTIFFQINFIAALRAILGTVYVLLLPGYVVVREFFNDDDLDWVEKAALSMGLSISLVILSVMFSNLIFRIPITPVTNFLVILSVMITTILIKRYQKEIKSRLSDFKILKMFH